MMTTLVEGDHARVVLEGRVSFASEDWVSIEDEHGFAPDEAAGLVSVTKLAPALPTTVGSVILQAPNYIYYLNQFGWRSITGTHDYRPEAFDDATITILHDAGAVA